MSNFSPTACPVRKTRNEFVKQTIVLTFIIGLSNGLRSSKDLLLLYLGDLYLQQELG